MVDRDVWKVFHKLGSDPAKGALYLVEHDRAIRLFDATAEGSVVTVVPSEQCEAKGFPAATVAQWIAAAVESVQPLV